MVIDSVICIIFYEVVKVFEAPLLFCDVIIKDCVFYFFEARLDVRKMLLVPYLDNMQIRMQKTSFFLIVETFCRCA